MVKHILLLDNNAVNKLGHGPTRERLVSNLRATGREFWPTAINVMEALKSRNPRVRTRLLTILSRLAGDNHAFPLPTEGMRIIAQAAAEKSSRIVWAEPRLTHLFREPGEISDEQAAEVRRHLVEQEKRFDATHQHAQEELIPVIEELGGRERWPDVASFLDEVWNRRGHIEGYVSVLWEEWELPGRPQFDELLNHRAWQLYFEGWGAALYARKIAHPQPPKVEHADLLQLVYCGVAKSAIFVSDDKGLRQLAELFLGGRHPRIEVVSLKAMTE